MNLEKKRKRTKAQSFAILKRTEEANCIATVLKENPQLVEEIRRLKFGENDDPNLGHTVKEFLPLLFTGHMLDEQRLLLAVAFSQSVKEEEFVENLQGVTDAYLDDVTKGYVAAAIQSFVSDFLFDLESIFSNLFHRHPEFGLAFSHEKKKAHLRIVSKRWSDTHREKVMRAMKIASDKRASESPIRYVYKDEVIQRIVELLAEKMTLPEIADALNQDQSIEKPIKSPGIFTAHNLKVFLRKQPHLRKMSIDNRKKDLISFQQELKTFYEQNCHEGKAFIINHFKRLGYDEGKIKDWLTELDLRITISWEDKNYNFEENRYVRVFRRSGQYSLWELFVKCNEEKGTTFNNSREYKAMAGQFSSWLKEYRLEVTITESSMRSIIIRKRAKLDSR
jgi:hypothetical protein